MKKLITIIAILICVNLSAQQEMTRNPYQKWMILYYDVPVGCDTTQNKGILEYQRISDKTIDSFIKENRIKDLRFGRLKTINDSEYWTSKGYCERVVYGNLSSIVRMEYTIWLREPKIDRNKPDEDRYKEIKRLFYEGKSKIEIDNIFYNKRKVYIRDALNVIKDTIN